MYIFHHNDDDGRCSAAIIYNEIAGGKTSYMTADNFIEYSHGMTMPEIPTDKLYDNEEIFIVDLALDNVIFATIEKLLTTNPTLKIRHIDHHKTTFEFLENLTDEQKDVMSKVRKLYRDGISASMLCWVYGCMRDEERVQLDDESIPIGDRDTFDFTDGYSHVGFNIGKPGFREIRVPLIVRYIDDWDVWRHAIDGTKEFHAGFGLVENKHPMEDFWSEYFYSNALHRLSDQIMRPGTAIRNYNHVQYAHMVKHAFEYTLQPSGFTILCLNSTIHTSEVFGKLIENYSAVCVYNYDGEKKRWTYSMYSSSDGGIDVSVICKQYGGGGHQHASGFQLPYNLFDDANK